MTRSSVGDADVLIRLRNASLGYSGRPVLPPVDLTVRRGDFLGLVGPNGSGKTTILRAILGLLRPLSGRISQGDPHVRFGYVPQRKELNGGWPLRTVDVVMMGLFDRIGMLRRPTDLHRAEAAEAMEAAGIANLAEAPFDSLSGGQKQRTLMARALVGHPSLLVLDEPTAGMDLPGSRGILATMKRIHLEGVTIVFVTHQLNDVANTTTHVALLGDEGLQVGPNREVLTSPNLSALYGEPVEVAEVRGRIVILEAGAPGA